MKRRDFCMWTGAAALGHLARTQAHAEPAGPGDATAEAALATRRTGNGEWSYQVVPGWGQLPPGKTFGGTHGGGQTLGSG